MRSRMLVRIASSMLLLCVPLLQSIAQDGEKAKIRSAMSAAPESIAAMATIMDWPAEPGGEPALLRKGSDQWTCFPDMPDTSGNDPMCLDGPWMAWVNGWMNKTVPDVKKMGFGYMLRGSSPESNVDPYAEGPTPDNEWMTKSVPHLMIVVPNKAMLEGLPVKPDGGGPWVMWRGTPYVHIMVPMPENHPSASH